MPALQPSEQRLWFPVINIIPNHTRKLAITIGMRACKYYSSFGSIKRARIENECPTIDHKCIFNSLSYDLQTTLLLLTFSAPFRLTAMYWKAVTGSSSACCAIPSDLDWAGFCVDSATSDIVPAASFVSSLLSLSLSSGRLKLFYCAYHVRYAQLAAYVMNT